MSQRVGAIAGVVRRWCWPALWALVVLVGALSCVGLYFDRYRLVSVAALGATLATGAAFITHPLGRIRQVSAVTLVLADVLVLAALIYVPEYETAAGLLMVVLLLVTGLFAVWMSIDIQSQRRQIRPTVTGNAAYSGRDREKFKLWQWLALPIGLALTVFGFSNNTHSPPYVFYFGNEGKICSAPARGVSENVSTFYIGVSGSYAGVQLECVERGTKPSRSHHTDSEYFSEGERAKIYTLARRLGDGGLSVADQEEIQELARSIAEQKGFRAVEHASPLRRSIGFVGILILTLGVLIITHEVKNRRRVAATA